MNSVLKVIVGALQAGELEEHCSAGFPVSLCTSITTTRVISELMVNTGQNGHLLIFMVSPFIWVLFWHHAGFLH